MRSLYCLLGDPVAHSRSPALMSRAFELLSVDAAYAPCQVSAAQLSQAVAGLRALGARGFNVTVPHKTRALELCDRITHAAGRIGAVNCVSREGDELVGHNTDAPGLLRALRAAGISASASSANSSSAAFERVVVVGAGGSAHAAAIALGELAGTLCIVNRTEEKARALAQVLRVSAVRAESAALRSAEACAQLAAATLVVQCTTIGLGTAELALDPATLAPGCAVVDLVYAGPPGSAAGDTALITAARARGLRTVDGLAILVHQAIASLEIWLARPQLDQLAAPLLLAAAAVQK